nr:hypothetical protein [Tanacetum cinerariifolium]
MRWVRRGDVAVECFRGQARSYKGYAFRRGYSSPLAQQKQHRYALGGVEFVQGQLADVRGAGDGFLHQAQPAVSQAADDFAAVLRVRVQADEVAGLQAIDDAADGRLINGGGLDQLGLRARAMITQRTQGDELHGGQLRIPHVLLKDCQMTLVGLAQQMPDLFRKRVRRIVMGKRLSGHGWLVRRDLEGVATVTVAGIEGNLQPLNSFPMWRKG